MSKSNKKERTNPAPRNDVAYYMIMNDIGKVAAGPMRDRKDKRQTNARKNWKSEDWGA